MDETIVLPIAAVVGLLIAVFSRDIASHSQKQSRRHPPWVKTVFGDCESKEYLEGTSALWRVVGLGVACLCILRLVGVG